MSALSRIRRAITLVATSVVVAKGDLDDLRKRVARKTVTAGVRGDESRLIGIELQVPVHRWRAQLILAIDAFEPALDCRLRILPFRGGPIRIRPLFPSLRRVHHV